ncbi:MAG: hypothetical protein AB7K52_02045 [Phycisphaerales bacterium]
MFTSWALFAEPPATSAIGPTLACPACFPTPMELLSPPLLFFLGFVWLCVCLRRQRVLAGSRLPICEHCAYNLSGIAFPGTCPECGGHACGTPVDSSTSLVGRGSQTQAVLIAVLATTLLAPLLEGSLLRVLVSWTSVRLDVSMRSRYLDFVEQVHPTAASVLAFFVAYLIAMPITPLASMRSVPRLAGWIAGGLFVLCAVAAAFEWSNADYVSPLTLMFRAAIWGGAIALLLRAWRKWHDRADITTSPTDAATPPDIASPSPPATPGSPEPAPRST